MLETMLILLILASWLYWLVALYLVFDFFKLRPTIEDSSFTPPISILKPVKGVDAQAYLNFASFCRQDYPEYEIIFGVAEPTDPVIPIIDSLRRDFPDLPIRLIVVQPFGANRKASLLHELEQEARYEMLVVSDSDMRATPDYLRRVVADLADEDVGLVTCPYRGVSALSLAARLEALHMGVTFLPSVIVARKFLNMRFAMGATVALRRSHLHQMGGFAILADYLADDYQLGARIASLGLKVRLSNYVVTCVLGATTFRDQWHREVRWMRCSRLSRPREYPGLLLSFSTPLSLALVLVTGAETMSLRFLLASMILRWGVAWLISGRTQDQESRRWLLLLPLRDLLTALTWCAGLIGRRAVWRGEKFELQPDGRMQPLVSSLTGRGLLWRFRLHR